MFLKEKTSKSEIDIDALRNPVVNFIGVSITDIKKCIESIKSKCIDENPV